MITLFELLQKLRQEALDFDISFTAGNRIRVSILAGSEHWIIEFSEEGLEWIEVFRSCHSSKDDIEPSIENLFSRVQRAWCKAAEDLNIEMFGNHIFAVDEDGRHEAPVFLPEFGSSKGTLLFLESSPSHSIDAAHLIGYYVSLISASSYDNYSRDNFIQALRDFGWSKLGRNPPIWYTTDA